MSQISTVVSSTFGTVICPIRKLYSRLVISDRCKVRNYPNRVLNKSCRPLAVAGGRWAELGRKLRQTYLLTPFSAKVIWLYDPGSSEPFASFATVSGLTTPVLAHPPFSARQVGLTPPLQSAACAAHLGLAGLYDPSDTLTTGIPIPGARTPSFAPVTGGTYAPTVATSVPFPLEAGWALRPPPNPLTTGALVAHPAFIATAGAHRAFYL